MELDKTKERPASGSSSDTEAEEEPLAGGGGAGSGVEPPGWRRRWTMLLLCFSGFVLCNLDRVNMAIAILPLSKDAGWDSATIGLVQSSFFWGYLATQMVGGVWADKHGAKRVLGLGVAWWSVSTVLTPLAARTSLPMLLAVRACMGLGEGVAFPATNSLLSKWVPPKERARSLALVHSGLYAGSMVGLAIAPHMIAHMGWPSVFYIFGSLGMGWYTWWEQQAASAPREDAHISRAELKFIRRSMALGSQQSIAGKATSIPWKVLLSKPPVLALILCHFCHSWGIFILATWMPTYYHEVLGLNLKESGLLSCLPYLTQAVTSNLAGWLADWLIDRGASVTLVRKGMQTVGFLGPAFFLTQLGGVREPRRAVSYLMAAQGLNAFVKAGLYCNHADIGPRYAGFLLGLSHTAGCLAGLIGTAATGYILQRGSWSDVWNVTVGFYLVGTIIWNAFSTGERVFD